VLAERTRQKLDLYAQDERVIQAARYCYNFGQDIVTVLSDPDDENLLVRLAAAKVFEQDERAREEQARKGMRK
jgi:hypothetical protein